jgi:hypothetical protein
MEEEIKFTSLISMTDFVLERKEHWRIESMSANGHELYVHHKHSMECENYANFFKTRLTLNMFIPCDEDGKFISEPKGFTEFMSKEVVGLAKDSEYYNYQEAISKILFKGCDFSVPSRYRKIVENITCIENLMMFGFELTPTAIKKILVS